jgi:hypothetical protein
MILFLGVREVRGVREVIVAFRHLDNTKAYNRQKHMSLTSKLEER